MQPRPSLPHLLPEPTGGVGVKNEPVLDGGETLALFYEAIFSTPLVLFPFFVCSASIFRAG